MPEVTNSAGRLICPEPLGGCGAACDDEDGSGNDWVCREGCGGEWNIHDVREQLEDADDSRD